LNIYDKNDKLIPMYALSITLCIRSMAVGILVNCKSASTKTILGLQVWDILILRPLTKQPGGVGLRLAMCRYIYRLLT